jgi:cytoskeletal protein CcmA (bactofilin family)
MKRDKKLDSSSIQNIISPSTRIKGDFNSKGDIRVDGFLDGNIKTSGKVVVGKDGEIVGKLECSSAYFEGSFNGEMIIENTLTLKSTAKIEGNVVAEKLSVEPGAIFNVSCVMKSTVKDLKSDSKTQKTA